MHAVPESQSLVAQGGNQCALVIESYSPCRMEIAGEEPDLENCVLRGTTRAAVFATFSQYFPRGTVKESGSGEGT